MRAPLLILLALGVAGCGSRELSSTSTHTVCAGEAATVRLRSSSSHGHIWSDLTLDLASGRLTGQTSEIGETEPRVTDVDEIASSDSVARLRGLLEASCGELAPAPASPDDFGGGTGGLTLSGGPSGTFVLVGAGVNDTSPEGTMRLETTRERYLETWTAFPAP